MTTDYQPRRNIDDELAEISRRDPCDPFGPVIHREQTPTEIAAWESQLDRNQDCPKCVAPRVSVTLELKATEAKCYFCGLVFPALTIAERKAARAKEII